MRMRRLRHLSVIVCALSVQLFAACTATPPATTAGSGGAETGAAEHAADPMAAEAPSGEAGAEAAAALTPKQRALVMAYAANTSGGMMGQDTKTMQIVAMERANCLIQDNDPDWTIVWGPVVVVKQNPANPSIFSCQYYAVPKDMRGKYIPTNTMFVAQNTKTPSELFVGIAGTNKSSAFAWCDEDFKLKPLSDWQSGSDAQGQIMKGTRDGLTILQNMKDLTRSADEQLLEDFLQQAAKSGPLQITVSGHSLGGALAPVTGLWLDDEKSNWGSNGSSSTVSIYAFAGATPGNQQFAKHMKGRFQGDSLVVVSNKYDLVPQAWNKTTMGTMETKYQAAGIQAEGPIKKTIDNLLPRASDDYTWVGFGTQVQPVTGELLTKKEIDKVISSCKANPFDPGCTCVLLEYLDEDTLMAFGMEAIDQHVCAYPNQLGLKLLLLEEGLCIRNNPYPPK